MEEEDIKNIAKAVSAAVGKLNADEKEGEKIQEPEIFTCPECGSKVNAMTTYCPNCGCPLEWEK